MADQRIDPQTGAFKQHVHTLTGTTWGVAHLGALLHEPRYLEWARRAYDFVVAHGTDYGWYPEFIPQGEYRTEICVVGDMTSTAVWLARGGYPHYWGLPYLRRTFATPRILDGCGSAECVDCTGRCIPSWPSQRSDQGS